MTELRQTLKGFARIRGWSGIPDIRATDPDIQRGGQFNVFPDISRLFLRLRVGQSLAKLDGGMAGFSSPGSATG